MVKIKPVDSRITYVPKPVPAEAPQPAAVAGKLYGLVMDPVKRFGYTFYFLVTASVDEDGQVISVDKSEQSWFMWEALHKLERQVELSCIEIQKTPEAK